MTSVPWTCDPTIVSSMIDGYHFQGTMFANTLQTFLAAQCALITPDQWPADRTAAVLEDPNYDFIVVGAGSAGAVVASRLSEIPNWKVLLVEAGGDPTMATEIPQLFITNTGSDIDWRYKVEPQVNTCLSYTDQRCSWPRGKVLGGCSSINGMFYVRGNMQDYNEWEEDGNQGWSYSDVLPYFKKSQHLEGGNIKEDTITKFHGKGGYLHTEIKGGNLLEDLIVKANNEAGLKISNDINGESQMGVTRAFSTIKDGRRMSTAKAFLAPIKDRPNLHVIKNALATKIVFQKDSNKVKGVVLRKTYMNTTHEFTVNVKKEVIVSGGSINSAQLLLLSGLGPKDDLNKQNINVIKDLPVGLNLQDHIFIPVLLTMPSESTYLKDHTQYFYDYIMQRSGPYATMAPSRVIDFMNTKDVYSEIPDIQHHYIVFPPNSSMSIDFFGKHGFNQEVRSLFDVINKEKSVILIYVVLLRPMSKGVIKLNTKNPLDHPLIYPNTFHDNDDLKTVIAGIKHAYKLDETESLRKHGVKLEWLDITPCRNIDKNSDDFLECWAKQMTMYLYHPVGTAKMGPKSDPEAVIDAELKVHGIEGLRVIDASVMPKIIRGNINAPIIMIAEKGADMIKSTWLNKKEEL